MAIQSTCAEGEAVSAQGAAKAGRGGEEGRFQGGLRTAFSENMSTRLGFLLARSGLRRFRHKLDPRRYNGAVFLGLNGISVKSHGGTDAFGFSNAIGVAVHMLQRGFIPEVKTATQVARNILDKGINERDE